ncbi:MAG: hypothetical protein KC431_11415 [Myxococcales bacterium]|nr:hypothetical protein [Myxococcales bacterium]
MIEDPAVSELAQPEAQAPSLYWLLRWTVPIHALLPLLIAATLMLGDDGLAEAAISWTWMAIHLLFPVALVLSYPWWRGRGDEVAAILVINHAVTFAVGIACLQWL